MSDESSPSQRVYGRGFVEGLKAAGVVNIGEAMNAARMKSIEDGLNGMEKKVYAVIPSDAPPISLPQIIGEMKEHIGSRPDMSVVKSCIAHLLDKRLVKSVNDKYLRIQKPLVVVSDSSHSDPAEIQPPAEKKPSNPIDRMAEIECKLKAIAAEVVALAKSVGDVAVDAEMFIEKIKDDNAKVAQLKELLKSL